MEIKDQQEKGELVSGAGVEVENSESTTVGDKSSGSETPVTEENKKAEVLKLSGWARARHVGKRTLQVILFLYALLVISRIPHAIEKQRTEPLVAKIHATKLTMDDVTGKNLPPDPGADANKTIAGIDANKNGIRDDVELAIFKEYASSSKTRAVLLQYALALQMEFTQPLVNTETVIAVAQETGRANSCIGEILSRNDMKEFIRVSYVLQEFVEGKQLNTDDRKKAQKDFYNSHLGSYSAIRVNRCDINFESL